MILVIEKWRGAVAIQTMRCFVSGDMVIDGTKHARAYYEKLAKRGFAGGTHWAYGYEVSGNAEPVLIWSCGKDKKAGK